MKKDRKWEIDMFNDFFGFQFISWILIFSNFYIVSTIKFMADFLKLAVNCFPHRFYLILIFKHKLKNKSYSMLLPMFFLPFPLIFLKVSILSPCCNWTNLILPKFCIRKWFSPTLFQAFYPYQIWPPLFNLSFSFLHFPPLSLDALRPCIHWTALQLHWKPSYELSLIFYPTYH